MNNILNNKWMTAALLLFSFLGALCGGCGEQKNSKLVIGTEATFPPYEFYCGEKIAGIDVDIVQRLANELGQELIWEDTSFDYLIDAVASGKIDMAASGITITEERKKKVDFTIPYAHSQLLVVVPEQSSIRNAADLKGKLIGVQKASTSDEYAGKHYKNPSRFPNVEIAAEALAAGKLDAIILDSGPARVLVSRYRTLKLLPQPLTNEDYGFAIRKNQPELLEKINGILRRMLASRTIEKISDSYYAAALSGSKNAPKNLLRVAMDPTFPPFCYLENGKPAGIEPDMLKLIAYELGMELCLEQVGFDLLLKIVQNDNGIDLGSSMLSITEERKQTVDFSIPYTTSSLRLMLPATSLFPAKAQWKKMNIGVVFGSTAESFARKNNLVPVCYSDNHLLVSAVKRKEVDFAFIDDEQANIAMQKDHTLKCLPDLLQNEQCAFAVRKSNKALLGRINTILQRFLTDGTIQKLREKHLKKMLK